MSHSRGRLAVLVKTFPKISETFILNEILGLERAGFELTIFALQRATDSIVQPAVARVHAEVVYLDSVLHGNVGDLERAFTLARQLRSRGIAHVHAHFIDRPAGIAAKATRLCGATFSISAHAKDIYLSTPALLRRRLGQAQFTATCTGFNHEALQAHAPEHAVVHRVYHGVDTTRFTPASDSLEGFLARRAARKGPARVLAVGRLRPKKGFGTLVEACALLRERGAEFECDIVGYGEEQAVLERRIAALGLGGVVRFRGKMTHAQLLPLMQSADVFTAPCEIASDGDRDGIPNVLLEAMACGVPVVTTPVSGIPEVVRDGVNGRLVPPSDAAALAAAIGELLADSARSYTLGVAARRTVQARFGEERNLRILAMLLAPYVHARIDRLPTAEATVQALPGVPQ